MATRLAIIDDEPLVCRRLTRALTKEGYEVESFGEGGSFLESFSRRPFQIVFTDLRLPGMDGLEVLSAVKRLDRGAEVIIITGYGSIDTAIEAMKRGAYHYVAKPLKLEEIRHLARGAREKIELREENQRLRTEVGRPSLFDKFIGASAVMTDVFETVKKVATVDCNVLIQGETGTGKELVARAIHALSPRRNHPFVSFNCGGFTEELISSELFGHERGAFTGAVATKIGLLESASKGTVFLDEIGEMPLSMQVKLLNVLQEKRILRVGGIKPIELDIRIVSASNRDLKKGVAEGLMREDLFYRLNVVSLRLPRLAERPEDIPLLVSHFVKLYSQTSGKSECRISDEAMSLLIQYDFPGNVRELENIIERAVVLTEGQVIEPRDLPPDLQSLQFSSYQGEKLLTMEEVERQHIIDVLKKTNYNKGLAAKILDLPRTTLWRRMKKYGLAE